MTTSNYNKPMKITGVYQIFIGDYFYHGSSNDCESRCKTHLKELTRNKHGNQKMQNVFNKYQSFDFQIIINCDDRDAAYAYEQDFIDTHFGLDKCLNLNAKASAPPGQQKGAVGVNAGKKLPNMSKTLKGNKNGSGKKGFKFDKKPCRYCGKIIGPHRFHKQAKCV